MNPDEVQTLFKILHDLRVKQHQLAHHLVALLTRLEATILRLEHLDACLSRKDP